MKNILLGLTLGFLIGALWFWGQGYDKGYKQACHEMEVDLIRNKATEYERWLIGMEGGV